MSLRTYGEFVLSAEGPNQGQGSAYTIWTVDKWDSRCSEFDASSEEEELDEVIVQSTW